MLSDLLAQRLGPPAMTTTVVDLSIVRYAMEAPTCRDIYAMKGMSSKGLDSSSRVFMVSHVIAGSKNRATNVVRACSALRKFYWIEAQRSNAGQLPRPPQYRHQSNERFSPLLRATDIDIPSSFRPLRLICFCSLCACTYTSVVIVRVS